MGETLLTTPQFGGTPPANITQAYGAQTLPMKVVPRLQSNGMAQRLKCEARTRCMVSTSGGASSLRLLHMICSHRRYISDLMEKSFVYAAQFTGLDWLHPLFHPPRQSET